MNAQLFMVSIREFACGAHAATTNKNTCAHRPWIEIERSIFFYVNGTGVRSYTSFRLNAFYIHICLMSNLCKQRRVGWRERDKACMSCMSYIYCGPIRADEWRMGGISKTNYIFVLGHER